MDRYFTTDLPDPVDPFTQAEQQQDAAESAPKVGGWEAYSRAVGETHILTNFLDGQSLRAHEDNPDWELPETFMDDMAEAGIPAAWGQELAESRSQAEYDARLELYKRKVDNDRLIGGGIGIRILASMTDPLGLAVDGAATMLGGAGAVTRFRRVAGATAAAGTSSALVGSLQAASDPTYDAHDVALDFAMGAALGTLFEAPTMLTSEKAFRTTIANKYDADIERSRKLIDALKSRQDNEVLRRQRLGYTSDLDEFGPEIKAHEERIAKLEKKKAALKLDELATGDSAGAARVPGSKVDTTPSIYVDGNQSAGGGLDVREPFDQIIERDADVVSLSNPLFGVGDIASISRNTGDAELDALGRVMFNDSVGVRRQNPDGTLVPEANAPAAEALATTSYHQMWGSFMRDKEQAMRKAFSGTKGFFKRILSPEARSQFNEAAGMVAKGLNMNGSQELKDAAAAFFRMTDDAWERMKAAGVKGISNARKVTNYVPRIVSRRVTDMLQGRFKGSSDELEASLTELYFKSIKSYREKAGLYQDDALSSKVAGSMAKRVLFNESNPETFNLNELDHDFLDSILTTSKLTPEEQQSIYLYFTKKDPVRGPDAQPVDFLKERMGLDESVSITLDDGTVLRMSDIYEQDLEYIADVYSKRVAGVVALAEQGFKNHPDFINRARAAAERFKNSHDAEKAKVWLHNVEMGYKYVIGQPIGHDPTGRLSKASRILSGVNFVQKMWQVGWSMLAENGAIMGVVGHRAMLQALPAYREIWQQVTSGTLPTERARELAALAQLGTSQLRNPASRRFYQDMGGFTAGKTYGKFENVLSSWEKLVAQVSGLNPLQDAQQLMLGYGWTQRLYNLATGVEKMTPAMRERIMDYGLRDQDIEALFDFMKTNAKTSNGVLDAINIEKMPAGLRRRFEVHLHKATTHAVQVAEIGGTASWQHNPIARLVFQFRAFSLTAFNRRTMHSLHRRDVTAGLMLTYGMMWGALALAGRTFVNYPEGHPMREKLKDPEFMIKAMFATTGESSILPMMWDTTMDALNAPDALWFGNAHRSTNSASQFFDGIPTVDLVRNIGRTVGIPGKLLQEEQEITDKDLKAVMSLVPWQTMLGWQRFNRWVQSQAPARELEISKTVENTEQ